MTFCRSNRRVFLVGFAATVALLATPALAQPGGGGKGNGNGGGGGGGGGEPPADPAIAFIQGTDTLSVMNADGTNETPIYQGEPLMFDPSWSPDGLRIAFTQSGATRELWLIDVEVVDGVPQGANARYLTDGGGESGAWDPAWSPLGEEIVYHTIDDGHKLWTISPDGGTPIILYAAQPDFRITGPEWSSDGLFIAFIERRLSGAFINIIDSTTGQLVAEYQPDPVPRLELSWARTQDVILYEAEKPSNKWLKADVHALDLTSGVVTMAIADGAWASWSPDDSQIVFQTVGIKQNVKVFDISTGETSILTKGKHPEWRRLP